MTLRDSHLTTILLRYHPRCMFRPGEGLNAQSDATAAISADLAAICMSQGLCTKANSYNRCARPTVDLAKEVHDSRY